MEYILEGKKAFQLLKSNILNENLIYNSILYDPISDKEIQIQKFEEGQFISENSKFPIDWLCLRDRELIFTENIDKIRLIVETNKTPIEKKEDIIKNFFKENNLSFNEKKLSQKEQNILIKLSQLKSFPSEYDQQLFFDVIKKVSKENNKILFWSSKFISNWLNEREQFIGKAHGLSRFQLTYIFRHTGELFKALQTSNVVELSRDKFECHPDLIAVICTVRAATYLDIFEFHNDTELLERARLTINKSWAIKKSSEASLVYKRLDKLKGEILKENYIRSINKAYKDWIRFH